MARGVGRPARPKTINPELLEATQTALWQLARDLNIPQSRYTDPTTGHQHTRPSPLDLAVLAIQAQEALEVLAAQQVTYARDHDNLTWGDIGQAFDIASQSAHHRFARKGRRGQRAKR